jgi:hypothetical protein
MAGMGRSNSLGFRIRRPQPRLYGAPVRLEAISDIPDGLDVDGTKRVGFHFGAKSGDAAVDAARREEHRAPQTALRITSRESAHPDRATCFDPAIPTACAA